MSVHLKISEPSPVEKPTVKLLYIDITKQNQNVQFILCTGAVFVFFLLYGYMQELLFSLEGFKPFGWYLTLVQFGYYTIFGFAEKVATGNIPRKIPFRTYLILALLTLGTMGFSNASLGFLNYPTQVIFKCCKLIPVLVGSILIQGKRYGPLDFAAALFMCLGLILFTLADSQISPIFEIRGVVMISIALLCDAIIGNVQEKSMKSYNGSNAEIVLFSYSIGFLYLLSILVFSGGFYDGFIYFSQDVIRNYGYALIFSLTGYLGVQIVLTLVRSCGAFAAVTVTTCRKAVTIVISFLFFSKPFVFQYLWSGLIVVGGIYLNMYSKKHPLRFEDIEMKLAYLYRYVRLKISSQKKYKQYMSEI